MTTALDMSADKLRRYRRDYRVMVREEFGVTPDPWQDDFLARLSVGEPQKVRESLQSCAGSGKSAALAWGLLCSTATNGKEGDHPQGVAISMSRDNLRAGLQKEVARWMGRSEFLTETFELTDDRLFATGHKKTWFVDFRTWSKRATPEEQGDTLSGLHAQAMNAYWIDEGGAIPGVVGLRAEQGMGDPNGRALIAMAGNPFNRETLLGEACDDPDYHTTEITADPDDPNRTSRVDADYARRMIETHGRDSPWVICFIMGQFPPGGINQLLTREEVWESMERNPARDVWEAQAKVLGVDIADEGLDASVITMRQGQVCFPQIEMQGVQDVAGAAMVARKWTDWKADGCFLDGTGGYGLGWASRLRDHGFNPTAVKFSETRTIPKEGFLNMRAYMAWECAEWVKNGGALPKDPKLAEALVAPTYAFKRDLLQIEDKGDIKARLGSRNPFGMDKVDSLWLTFAGTVKPRGHKGHDAFARVKGDQAHRQRTRAASHRWRD